MEINFSNASEEEIKIFYKKISENVKYYREQKKNDTIRNGIRNRN